MCGIIGYIGREPAVPILIEGLKKLEYRGYDSSGVAVLQNHRLEVRRAVGKLQNLENLLRGETLSGMIGVGHVRWATHGRPSEENAHPHRAGSVVVVHNGIIENYTALKKELMSQGRTFLSETDTEVIAHLIDSIAGKGLPLEKAVREAVGRLQGAYAIAVIDERSPDIVVGARKGSPLVIGLGQGEFFLASDIPAILHRTRDVLFLNDDEMAVLSDEGVRITDLQGAEISREITRVLWNPVMAEKGGYRHFMLKEIYEQPRAIMDTMRGRISPEMGVVHLEEIDLSPEQMSKVKKIFIVA
jgi:glucosamine--fructose-6-phosphate aminotransferase (isomerizing)